MERLPVQSWGWRIFGVVALGLFIWAAPRMDAQYASATWEFIRDLYWWFAPFGLLGYAFGLRVQPLGRTFWRVYSVVFTLDMIWRCLIRVVIKPPPFEWTTVQSLVFVVIAGAAAFMCLGLLRYADLVGGGRRPEDDQALIYGR